MDTSGMPSSTADSAVQRRVRALRRLQARYEDTRDELADEVHRAECRFLHRRLQPLRDAARLIISGGVPEFWLRALQGSSEAVSRLVRPHDEAALRHLQDVRLLLREDRPLAFGLAFTFDSNPFFSNQTLVKHYDAQAGLKHKPVAARCSGCDIRWRSRRRDLTRPELGGSFFELFASPPLLPDEETLRRLRLELEAALAIRERAIPRALDCYLLAVSGGRARWRLPARLSKQLHRR